MSKSKLCYDRRSVGQSVLVSSPIWGPRPDFCYYWILAGLLMWPALSDETTGLSFKITVGPRKRIFASESRGPNDHILLSQIGDSRNLEGRMPVFISPRNRVAIYTPGHWFLFSSPRRTRRTTVELFEPASTRETQNCVNPSKQSQSYFTTGGLPPFSSSWRQAPPGSLPHFFCN
jgi:hypothetical protein